MIFGIGTDIVNVARMERILERHGERFARRILTDNELAGYGRTLKPAHFLAKRFAAKEAAVKALGLGFRRGLSTHTVGVRNDDHGRPLLEFTGRALEVLDELGVGEAHLSIADEQDHAIAFVILLKRLT